MNGSTRWFLRMQARRLGDAIPWERVIDVAFGAVLALATIAAGWAIKKEVGP